MPSKRRRVRKDQVDSLISEVNKEPIIWDETNKNHKNGYLIEKAWDRIAKILECTVGAVKGKWEELCSERKDLIKTKPRPTSGSAGGKELDSWEEFESMEFLKDKHTPPIERTGNLDNLLQEPSAKTSNNTPVLKAQDSASTTANINMTDEQFFLSILYDISSLSDEEKLYFRIDMMQLLCNYDCTSDDSDDDEDLIIVGSWIPEKSKKIIKKIEVKKEERDE